MKQLKAIESKELNDEKENEPDVLSQVKSEKDLKSRI